MGEGDEVRVWTREDLQMVGWAVWGVVAVGKLYWLVEEKVRGGVRVVQERTQRGEVKEA